jgi:hypothetical protein
LRAVYPRRESKNGPDVGGTEAANLLGEGLLVGLGLCVGFSDEQRVHFYRPVSFPSEPKLNVHAKSTDRGCAG